ncbi:BLUF domain-containing protein [Spirosoma rhododendri]|uniref:BLUF domain-containing protein n=1 Tax=Spirosoma rhododendri TaxID=2728024 RepID=A0A7L5DLR9_9BACT|nr:BLUF domain-containing protein [Spirosoma rhododendri]QJD79424.1 BLUF domain-containing protein [Spirosoma rhododendri]
MDYCITYFSSAVETTTEQIVVDIVDFSRDKNARLGITGVLLYINGHIVQVLEGQQQAVEALYNSIQADPRHTDVRTVIHRPITQRLFSHWYMGYETLTTHQYAEVQDIISIDPQHESAWDIDQPVVVRMLRGFFDLNSRQRANT